MLMDPNSLPYPIGPEEQHTAECQRQTVVVVDSSQLLAGRKEVQIRHHGEVYRLRVTRNGKLILNK